MRTYLKYRHSIVRSLLLPIFTANQAIFMSVAAITSVTIVIVIGGDVSIYFSLALIFSAIGALSISAPSFMIIDRKKGSVIEDILLHTGWKRHSREEVWIRSEKSLSKWENDQIDIVSDEKIILIFGPYYTLRMIKRRLS